MHATPARTGALAAILASAILSAKASPRDASETRPVEDPLAAEIARLQAGLASSTATGEIWDSVRNGSGPMLLRAETALQDGRRWLALNRLAAAREGLSAARYLYSLPEPQRQDPQRFEAEWRRVGELLRGDLDAPAANALDGVAPAAARAIGEAALPQVRVYYEASLEYGQNTQPDSGLYYIGTALAAARAHGLPARPELPGPAPAPPLRSLEPELAALEAELLAAYRPPASIDRHVEFIRASAALKEARELDALGLRYGALLRYLQALQRLAPARSAPAAAAGASAPSGLAASLRLYDERLAARGVDHTIGRLFLETAQADLAGPGQDADPAAAQAIVEHCAAALLRSTRACGSAAAPARARASPSRSCAGPTPETSPTQQVCWRRASWRNRAVPRVSWSRTTATRRSRSASA